MRTDTGPHVIVDVTLLNQLRHGCEYRLLPDAPAVPVGFSRVVDLLGGQADPSADAHVVTPFVLAAAQVRDVQDDHLGLTAGETSTRHHLRAVPQPGTEQPALAAEGGEHVRPLPTEDASRHGTDEVIDDAEFTQAAGGDPRGGHAVRLGVRTQPG